MPEPPSSLTAAVGRLSERGRDGDRPPERRRLPPERSPLGRPESAEPYREECEVEPEPVEVDQAGADEVDWAARGRREVRDKRDDSRSAKDRIWRHVRRTAWRATRPRSVAVLTADGSSVLAAGRRLRPVRPAGARM